MYHLLELIRIRQWTKNLFVFVGVFFAELLFTPILKNAILVFLTFCFAASIIYILNDMKDMKKDKGNPIKTKRVLASGKMSLRTATGVLAIMLTLLVLGFLMIPVYATGIIFIYILFNMLYNFQLKQMVILDVFAIAFSFVLRVLAGTVGLGVEASAWLLVTVVALSLFLILGKRYNEKRLKLEKHRKVLKKYTLSYLQNVLLVTAILSIAFYSIYIVETNRSLFHIATVPLVIYGFFRYLYVNDVLGGGGDPTEELFKDKHILVTTVVWVCLIFLGTTL